MYFLLFGYNLYSLKRDLYKIEYVYALTVLKLYIITTFMKKFKFNVHLNFLLD